MHYETISTNITHYKHTIIPNKPTSIKSIPMKSLIEQYHMLRPMEPEIDIPNWAYGLISLAVAILIGIGIFIYCNKLKRIGATSKHM